MRAQSGRARAIFALGSDHGTGDRPEEIGTEHVHCLADSPHEPGDERMSPRTSGMRAAPAASAASRASLPAL